MTTEEKLVNRYRRAKMLGMKICDMDASALAGYYIDRKSDPIFEISFDIKSGVVPAYIGNACKLILLDLCKGHSSEKEETVC